MRLGPGNWCEKLLLCVPWICPSASLWTDLSSCMFWSSTLRHLCSLGLTWLLSCRWEVRLVQLWSGKIISVQTVCALSIRVLCTSCPLNMNSLGQCKSSVLLSHVQLFKEKLQGGKRDIIQTAWAIGAVALFWEQPKAAERMHTVHKSYPYWVPCGKDFTSLTANVTAHS